MIEKSEALSGQEYVLTARFGWDAILSEQGLTERYGLTKRQIAALRAKGMPYLALSYKARLYEEDETVGFLVGLRRVEPRQAKKPRQKE